VNLAQLLVRAARVHPDRPALLHGDRLVWRYGELARASRGSPAICARSASRRATASPC
jgi:hypothetical protein